MTHEELKTALRTGEQVEYNGIRYKRISALIYRNLDGRMYLQAELESNSANCIVIAEGAKITPAQST